MKTPSVLAILTAVFLLAAGPAAWADTVPSDKGIAAVNHLIERHTDAEKGFKDAAANVNEADLRDDLLKKSEERRAYREELQAAVARLGEKYEKGGGSLEGAAYRAWIDVKAFVTDENNVAVLNAVRTGEEDAVESFKDVLGEPLNDELRKTVQKQFKGVLSSYNWIVDEIKNRTKAEA